MPSKHILLVFKYFIVIVVTQNLLTAFGLPLTQKNSTENVHNLNLQTMQNISTKFLRTKTQSSGVALQTNISTTTPTTVEPYKYSLVRINERIEQERHLKKIVEATFDKRISSDVNLSSEFKNAVKFMRTNILESKRKALIKEINDIIHNLLIERAHFIIKISQKPQNPQLNFTLANSDSQLPKSLGHNEESLPNDSFDSEDENDMNSKFVCQVFVFGTIFGVVCTISICSWSFSKRDSDSNGSSSGAISRLTGTPEPFDSSKPYCLKIDEKGMCYASPLPKGDIPPLPSYTDALKMSPPKILTMLFEAKQNVDRKVESLTTNNNKQ